MRYGLALFFSLLPASVGASDAPMHLMSAADTTCSAYLSLPPGDEREKLEYWVAGRIVAIVPATFQPALAGIPFRRMQRDLRTFCQGAGFASLFQASAVLASDYQGGGGEPRLAGRPAPLHHVSPGAPAFEAFYDREQIWSAQALARRAALLPQIKAYQRARASDPPGGPR